MINLTELLLRLGPGYWAEFRYYQEALEFNLHFRNAQHNLVMRKSERYTLDLIKDNPEWVEDFMNRMADEMEAAVKSKIKGS